MIWQGVDPVEFIRAFPDRIYHVHMKDAIVTLNGRQRHPGQPLELRRSAARLGLPLAGPRRRELRGDHPRPERRSATKARLSVEWEDSGMDRDHGAKEACEFVRKLDFEPSRRAFDAAFDKAEQA